jgi:DNA-binding XRE family transcriptional regulator
MELSPLVFGENNFNNPFREIRLVKQLTIMHIADAANVTKHNVIRTEQGMSIQPPPTLLNYFVETFPVSRLEMINQYEKFQVHQRSLKPRILGNLRSYSPGVHPFIWLRHNYGYNPTSLAKALCLNQTVVVYFESNPIKQQTVPAQIVNALKDNGYNDEELNILNENYQSYRDHLRSRQNVRAATG